MKTLPTGPSPLSAVAGVAFGVAGTGLGLVLGLVAVARRGKPLHPVGIVAPAVLSVSPGSVRSGSPLLDDAGEHSCLVRASYAMGTGPEHADIEGFALRVHPEGAGVAVSDILFASTGTGAVGRHVLTLRRAGAHDVQTTLFPLHVDGRALLLRLEPLDPGSQPWPTRYRLSWAHGHGGWHEFAELVVTWDGRRDAPERFDPVAHPLPGTAQYPVLAWLREPAYRLARLARPSAGRLP
ncbi:MAG: phosphodiesterase [Pedococcus sp.]